MRRVVLLLVAGGVFVTMGAAAPAQNSPRPSFQDVAGGRGANPAAAPPATGTGLIVGRVVEADTNAAVAGAVVALAGRGVSPPRVIVDGQGRFVFRDLPAGDLTLAASKPGYFGGGWGQHSPSSPARPLDLGDGERLGDVTLRLWKYATVRGEITDDANQPVVGAEVLAFRRAPMNGRWQFSNAGTATTDDRGAFSVTDLMPGTYILAARPVADDYQLPLVSMLFSDSASFMSLVGRIAATAGSEPDPSFSGKARTYAVTFFPQTLSPADATLISLKAAEEHTGVNVRVHTVPRLTVSGTVTGMSKADSSERLRLTLPDAASMLAPNEMTVAIATSDNAGQFTFTDVPAGQYVIRATSTPMPVAGGARGATPNAAPGARGARGGPLPPTPTDPILAANLAITLEDTDLHDIAIELRPGLPVSGHVEFQGQSMPPDPSQYTSISFSLAPLDSSPAEATVALRGRVEEDGTFRSAGVVPGTYLLRMGSIGRWRPASAMLAGRDLLDQPIEIDAMPVDNIAVRFTDVPLATLTGTVHNGRGAADAEAVILIFPTDRALWGDLTSSSRRVKAARTTRSGYYAIPGLAPGDYYIVASADALLTDWPTPTALETAARTATRLTIADGEKKTMDLQSRSSDAR